MWGRIRQWIDDNAKTVQFLVWAIGVLVAAGAAVGGYFGFAGKTQGTYARDCTENFSPEDTKIMTCLCNGNDAATGWKLLPVNTNDASPTYGNVRPIVSGDGRQLGFSVQITNGAGKGMGHRPVDFTVQLACKR